MFLKHSKEISLDKKDKKKMKKRNNTYSEHGNRMTIIVDNYDADVFRSFLLFVHCGSVVIDVTTVTGKHFKLYHTKIIGDLLLC